jgi:DNA-binding GntR family transcriptional regulator
MEEAMLSQTDRAYNVLKTRIVNLELPPGAILREDELTETLGLGRTPIREALQRLARDDLVIILPRRGMYVAEIGVTDLKQIFEARIPLETWSARLAAERITDAQLARLDEIIQGLAESQDAANYAEILMEGDHQIHAIISEATNNKFLIDGVRWLYDLTSRIWKLSSNPVAGAESIRSHHRALLDALRARDADQAEAVMRQNILDFWGLMRSQV